MEPAHVTGPLRIRDWIVDPATDEIRAAQGPPRIVKLEPRLMRLLLSLAQARGQVVSSGQLLEDVWPDVVVGPASVYQSISQLRRHLGDTEADPTYIATVPRKGYRLVASVEPVQEATAGPADAPASLQSRPTRRPTLLMSLAAVVIGVALLTGFWLLRQRITVSAPTQLAIAVLPFVDLSAAQDSQILGDGLSDELSNHLAQLPTLRVVARASAFQFRERAKDARLIGRELSVTHIVDGSIRRAQDRLRVIAQLVDARSGFQVWARSMDVPFSDLTRLQEEIARSIAGALEIELSGEAAGRFERMRATDSRAYELFLLGRHYRLQRKAEANARAIELLQGAVAADPGFAPAQVELAYALLNQHYFAGDSMERTAARMEPLLARAAILAPELPDLYVVRGALRADLGLQDEAIQDLQRAIRLNPNHAVAYRELGRTHRARGEVQAALDSYNHATALDPRDFMLQNERCNALRDMRRFDEARVACERARALEAGSGLSWRYTALLELGQGRLDAALEANTRALRAAPADSRIYEERAELWLLLGWPERARTTYEQSRAHIDDDEWRDMGLAEIEFVEKGPQALVSYLQRSHLPDSTSARTLLSVARYYLLAGQPEAARDYLARMYAAPNFSRTLLYDPQVYLGSSGAVTVAAIQQRSGNETAAEQTTEELSRVLDHLERSGQQSWGVHVLRAQIALLRGDADLATKTLARAAELGWRGAVWAEREPLYTPLWGRADFRAILVRLGKDIDGARERLSAAGLPANQ